MESEDIILRQTTNYQLPSWDSDDRILRTDFNELTEKTDTALADNAAAIAAEAAARAAAAPYVTLADITTSEAKHQVDIDVSQIDFDQYMRIDLRIDPPNTESLSINLRLNGITSERYYQITTMQNNRYTTSLLSLVCNGVSIFWLNTPAANSKVTAVHATGSLILSYAPCTWGELETLNFATSLEDGNIPAGTRFLVKGLRK